MNPWTKYVMSLIHIPGPGEPPPQAVLFLRGRGYERIAFDSTQSGARPSDRCAECGARHLSFHVGYCSQEQCPACGKQLITCGCFRDRLSPWVYPICLH